MSRPATVNRGEMAAFITRALAHTSVRPAGVLRSVRTAPTWCCRFATTCFQPVSNVLVDAFFTDTTAVDLAFRANGSCGEVSTLGSGQHSCEVDGADPLTGDDGDERVEHTVPRAGTTVWAWDRRHRRRRRGQRHRAVRARHPLRGPPCVRQARRRSPPTTSARRISERLWSTPCSSRTQTAL